MSDPKSTDERVQQALRSNRLSPHVKAPGTYVFTR
jgi:hypothetical protein